MTTKIKDVWYHCGHCGSLFQSIFEFDEDRLCEVCGKSPSIGVWPVSGVATPVSEVQLPGVGKKVETVANDEYWTAHKKRQPNIMLRVVIIWILLMLAIVGVCHYFIKS